MGRPKSLLPSFDRGLHRSPPQLPDPRTLIRGLSHTPEVLAQRRFCLSHSAWLNDLNCPGYGLGTLVSQSARVSPLRGPLFQVAFVGSLETTHLPTIGSALSSKPLHDMSSSTLPENLALHTSSIFATSASLGLVSSRLGVFAVSRYPFQNGQLTVEGSEVRFRCDLSIRQPTNVDTFTGCFLSQHPSTESPP